MTAPTADRRLGTLLVALQFLLMAVLAAFGLEGLTHDELPVDPFLLAAVALLLGVWALAANRPGNFNIRPTPREGGHLVQHGPYRWIRHPMYSAVMLAGLAAARLSEALPAWLAFACLVAVLAAKAVIEERAMISRHPDYAGYRQRTRRFVPWLL